jgi:hypothetical protein
VDWREHSRGRLPAHLDAHGDLAPPWERYPDYERYCIGWRMGAGEDWMCLWSVFLEQLPEDRETRLAYLRRHPPAPVSWADSVAHVLDPSEETDEVEDDPDRAASRRASLLEEGLVASDVAYRTWLAQQKDVRWPWERNASPEAAARHDTRALWFWSRRIAELRSHGAWTPPVVPNAWQSCARAIETGDHGALDVREGLLTLARMLCAGEVKAPWQLGLTPSDFGDSVADDMGYVDAFRLWAWSAFDDAAHLRRYLDSTRAPSEWNGWLTTWISVE